MADSKTGYYPYQVKLPENSDEEFVSYTLELMKNFKGFAGMLRLSNGTKGSFTAVFQSEKDLNHFVKAYEKSLKRNYDVAIWEKANGAVISNQSTLNALVEFSTMMDYIKPVLDFIETHGGWYDGKDFPGFTDLEATVQSKEGSKYIKNAYHILSRIMMIYFVTEEVLSCDSENPEDGYFAGKKKEMIELFIRFKECKMKFDPAIDYINANGGWIRCDGTFPGYEALDTAYQSYSLSREVIDSVSEIKSFVNIYLSGKEKLEGETTFRVLPCGA